MKSAFAVAAFILVSISSIPGEAKTLVLDGSMTARIRLSQRITFAASGRKGDFTYRFALPSLSDSRSVKQKVENLSVEYSPQPATVRDETDRFGNRFRKVEWRELSDDARVTITYDVDVRSELAAMHSSAPFPLHGIGDAERVYLEETQEVQSSSGEITALSGQLTKGAVTEYAAVTAIMNYVANSIGYSYNPPQYDALYTLHTGSGNCQNFAHLALALLRGAGIPARIVGGISLREAWKVPVSKTASVVQSMGQGGHAWIEIYFPDLGWLAYDPQQSLQFTSTRHIKQTHGLDSKDINDTWRGTRPLPRYGEVVEADFLVDRIKVSLTANKPEPRGYLVSNRITASTGTVTAVPVLPTEKPQTIKPVPIPVLPSTPIKPSVPAKPSHVPGLKKPAGKGAITIGNTSFPSFVELYQTVGDTATRILDKETAEYVTSRSIYAQAFTVGSTIRVSRVSLAMKKFGGDGTIYIDLVADDKGRPGLSGIRSLPVYLERIPRSPGYGWVDFSLPDNDTLLKKGKYWIVLRHSGEAVMNWFFTPGKRFGDAEDTRSTARGWQWEDILTYDFVFRLDGWAL